MKVVDRSRLLVIICLEAKKTCRIHWKKSSRGHSGADDLSGRSDEYMSMYGLYLYAELGKACPGQPQLDFIIHCPVCP